MTETEIPPVLEQQTPAVEPASKSDTSTPPAPALSEHCTTDRPTPIGQASTGEIVKLGEIECYISKPSDYPHAPTRLLLLLTGGTGLKSINNQIQADKFATEGFLVVMPDLFGGDPAPNQDAVREAAAEVDSEAGGTSLLDSVKLKAAEVVKSFTIDMWLARHTQEKVMPLLHRVIDAAKDEYADAVANGIYAVGYCFGGRYVLLLAAERAPVSQTTLPTSWTGQQQKTGDEESGMLKKEGPFIKAGALAHATLVSPDDFEGLKAPVSLVCVESDPLFPDEVRKIGEDYMSKNAVEHEVQVYPKVPHGFAVVGDYADANIKEAQVVAHEQMLKWLKEH